MYYCWTHSSEKNRSYTSPTCTHPAEGHINNTTTKNMMGGSNWIMTGCQLQSGNWEQLKPRNIHNSIEILLPCNNLTTENCSSTGPLAPDISPAPNIQCAIADTGSTHNCVNHDTPIINKCTTQHPIAVRNPNSEIMLSTHEAEFNIPILPHNGRHIHILPDIQSDTRLSIGRL